MTPETIFIFTIAIILMHIKPGPGQALRITTALKDGFLPAFLIAVGVAIICNIYLILAAVGSTIISGFFQNSGIYFKIGGGLYLIYLGAKGLKSNTRPSPIASAPQKKYLHYLGLGLLLSLSNPIDIFFFVGILPGLIDMTALNPFSILIFMAIFTAVTLFIDVLILTLTVQSKEFISGGVKAVKLSLVANIGLILIGVYLIFGAVYNGNFSYGIL